MLVGPRLAAPPRSRETLRAAQWPGPRRGAWTPLRGAFLSALRAAERRCAAHERRYTAPPLAALRAARRTAAVGGWRSTVKALAAHGGSTGARQVRNRIQIETDLVAVCDAPEGVRRPHRADRQVARCTGTLAAVYALTLQWRRSR